MPALLLLGEAQRSFVSSFEVLNDVLRPTGTDQPVVHWRSCPATVMGGQGIERERSHRSDARLLPDAMGIKREQAGPARGSTGATASSVLEHDGFEVGKGGAGGS
jgi:hypothetical protein